MLRTKALMLGALLTLAYSPTARAEQYLVRAAPDLPAEVLVNLARSSEPSWHTVALGEGTTLRDLVRRECGDQKPETFSALLKEVSKINHESNVDKRILKGVTVGIPFCLRFEKKVPITVQQNDTVESILKREGGFFGQKSKSQFYELNQKRFDTAYENVDEMSRHLVPGMELTVPYRTEQRLFSAVNKLHQPGEIAKSFSAQNPDLNQKLIWSQVHSDQPSTSEFDVEYVGGLSTATASVAPGCVVEEGKEGPLAFTDIALLKQRLDAEGFTIGNTNLVNALVGLIDSGIRLSTFSWPQYFQENRSEKIGTPKKDDDDNGRIDDIYGLNFNMDNGSIDYYETDPYKSHGTRMASLVLGGPDFLNDNSVDPYIRLKMVNFSSSTRVGTMGPRDLPSAIEYLKNQKANIVNMSLATKKEFHGLRTVIDSTSDVLFVVAAGNGDRSNTKGIDIGLEAVYPARSGGFGGFLKDKVLTVGAHDLNGNLARFSNFSKDFVDILAPGCSVRTVDVDGKVVSENGTSPATAITAFAAGLLRHLGISTAIGIKNRLLYSANVEEKLSPFSWSSGRLNIVKAISLHHDIVELRSTGKYIFGKLSNPDDLASFCDDPDKALHLKHIVKVRPNIGNEIEYWTVLHGQLTKTRCKQTKTNETVAILNESEHKEEAPDLAEIVDIVLSKPN